MKESGVYDINIRDQLPMYLIRKKTNTMRETLPLRAGVIQIHEKYNVY